MAQQLSLRVGEINQLRAHGEVERWTSAHPQVVTVTDEDIVSGRPGGLLTALSPGQARITAYGFSGEHLVEVDVSVEGARIITLAAGESAPPGTLPGTTPWISRNPQVADAAATGELRGIAPGIAIVRQETSGAELQVRVTGAREIEVNQSLALAGYFSVPVRAWRVGSTAASIDGQGVVTAGDRPRSVSIFATLEDGSEFSFDLRIIRASTAAPQTPDLPLPPQPRGDPPIVDQRQQVEAHLARAEALIQQKAWQQAGSELMAAELAATGDDALRARVQTVRTRLRTAVLEGAAAGCVSAAAALRQGRFAQARELLRTLRIPTDQNAIPSQLGALAGVLEALRNSADNNEANLAQLRAVLESTWSTAQAAGLPGVLVEIAGIAVAWGIEEMVPVMINGLAETRSAGYPAAMREAMESSLNSLGDAALAELLRRLSLTENGDPSGQGLLNLLASLNPGKRASLVAQLYRRMTPPERARLVEWLSVMTTQSYGVVLDLVAGILRKLPPDPGLARALRSRIGPAPLEQAAITWASGGHKGAQEVLMRLYDYPASAFKK